MSDKKTKSNLKEKFVTIYEAFFKVISIAFILMLKHICHFIIIFKGDDFTYRYSTFWEELFLLKINSNYIINEFKNLTNDDLIKIKVKTRL